MKLHVRDRADRILSATIVARHTGDMIEAMGNANTIELVAIARRWSTDLCVPTYIWVGFHGVRCNCNGVHTIRIRFRRGAFDPGLSVETIEKSR